MRGTVLDASQRQHFETFGLIALHQLFDSSEVELLRGEYEAALDSAYRHSPFDGSRRHWTMMLGEQTPLFASLPEGERNCRVAEQLYGEDALGVGTDANRYVGDTRWHPDE